MRALVALAFFLMVHCARGPSSTLPELDASGPALVSVRLPAALTLARSLDTLTVAVDPASLAVATLALDPGMRLGVETNSFVFAQGAPRPAVGRTAIRSGTDLEAATSLWDASRDELPLRGVRYVAEVELAVFETDVPPSREWNPHAGLYRVLWDRTLRQTEE